MTPNEQLVYDAVPASDGLLIKGRSPAVSLAVMTGLSNGQAISALDALKASGLLSVTEIDVDGVPWTRAERAA